MDNNLFFLFNLKLRQISFYTMHVILVIKKYTLDKEQQKIKTHTTFMLAKLLLTHKQLKNNQTVAPGMGSITEAL